MKRKMSLVAIVVASICLCAFGLWCLFAPLTSFMLEQWLHRKGFQDVTIRMDSPGWDRLIVPEIVLSRVFTGERVTIQLKDSEMDYSMRGLFQIKLDRVLLTDVNISIDSIDMSKSPHAPTDGGTPEQVLSPSSDVLTVSDLAQGVPILSFGELQLGRVSIIREQATGPFREMDIAGTIRQDPEGLVAELTLHGKDTPAYDLRASDRVRAMSIQLQNKGFASSPIFTWRSEINSDEFRMHLHGVFDADIQQLAPFLALILPLGSQWQHVTGKIHSEWTGTASSGTAIASVWRDPGTQIQGGLHVETRIPEVQGIGKDLAMTFSAQFSGNAAVLHWSVDPGTIATAAIEMQNIPFLRADETLLLSGSQIVRVECSKRLDGEIHWTDSPFKFTAKGLLKTTYDSQDGPIHAEAIFDSIAGRGMRIDRAEGTFGVNGSLPRATRQRIFLREASGKLLGRLTLNGEDITGSISPSSSLKVTNYQRDMVKVTQGTARFLEALPFSLNVMANKWTVGPSVMMVLIPEIRLPGHQVRTKQTALKLERLAGESTSWQGLARVRIKGLEIRREAAHSAPFDVTARIVADSEAIFAEIEAGLENKAVTLKTHAQHAFVTGKGMLKGQLGPVIVGSDAVQVQELWSPWPVPITLTRGTLTTMLALEWEKPQGVNVIAGTADVSLMDLAGRYQDFIFKGVTADVHVVEKPGTLTLSPASAIRIASLNRGVEVTNIGLTAQGEWKLSDRLPLVEVRNFRCQLLGGVLTSQGARADLARPPYSATFLARGLDLKEILSLEQQKGLQGTGLLDGTIPVTVTERGAVIQDGMFEARPPGGVVQYQPTAETAATVIAANPNMQLVLQALGNFHYNVLQIGAQYAEDGTLILKAQLEGQNPDLKKTPPVHFNLTVQENIPALLRSLRLVQDIEESVQNRFVGQ